MSQHLVIRYVPNDGRGPATFVADSAYVFDIAARTRFQPDGTSISEPYAGAKVPLADVVGVELVSLDEGLTEAGRIAALDAVAAQLEAAS